MSTIAVAPARQADMPARPAPTLNSVAAVAVLLLLLAGGVWSLNSLGINLATIADSLDCQSVLTRFRKNWVDPTGAV